MTEAPAGATKSREDPFNLKPNEFLNDLANAVFEITADGFDAYEETVQRHLATSRPDLVPALGTGISDLYERVQGLIGKAFDSFDLHSRATAFLAPPALLADLEKSPELRIEVTDEMDSALDRQLEELRTQVVACSAACRQMRQEGMQLDRELRVCSDAEQLQKVAMAASVGGRQLAEDAAAIAQISARLKPLLARAERLRQSGPQSGAGGFSAVGAGAADIEREFRRQQAAAGGVKASALEEAQRNLPL